MVRHNVSVCVNNGTFALDDKLTVLSLRVINSVGLSFAVVNALIKRPVVRVYAVSVKFVGLYQLIFLRIYGDSSRYEQTEHQRKRKQACNCSFLLKFIVCFIKNSFSLLKFIAEYTMLLQYS